jgi:thiamine-phosphate pyrophosphorylase
MPLNLSKPILYLITRGATTEATTPDAPEFTEILNQISAAVAAGIDLIQIREKQLTARVLFELVSEARKLTLEANTRLLVNDRADIAAGAGADGVHLTTESLCAGAIRRAFGEKLLIGASTHSLEEARAARDQGADFAVFGPVFETESKLQFGSPKGLAELTRVVRAVADFPVLALGGISRLNAADCLAAGAYGISGISLFDNAENFSSLMRLAKA